MLADGHYVDGSWLLTIQIDSIGSEQKVRVKGDWSVDAVIGALTQDLPPPPPRPIYANDISLRTGVSKSGWGNHALWWPAKKRWLLQGRLSLNQYGLQADALLRLVPIYGRIQIRLPDLQIREFSDVNFTEPVFRLTVSICRHLGIRHPEELSLALPLSQHDIRKSRLYAIDRRHHTRATPGIQSPFQRSATLSAAHSRSRHSLPYSSMREVNGSRELLKPVLENGNAQRYSFQEQIFGPPRVRDKRTTVRPLSQWNQQIKVDSHIGSIHVLSFETSTLEDSHLSSSPAVTLMEALQHGLIVHPSNFIERARLNSTWLDSAKSLMEQGITTKDPSEVETRAEDNQSVANGYRNSIIDTRAHATIPVLVLRYKYGTIYDLNYNYDAVRINQLFEQAKWSLITEQLEVTDDEACLLAALQAHAEIAAEREREQLQHVENDQLSIQNGFQDTTVVDATLPSNVLSVTSGNKAPIPRDTSPIGGYLRHRQISSRTTRRARPLSAAELDFEIDAILDELSSVDTVDATSIGGSRRSRPLKRRAHRPVSHVSTDTDDPGPPQLSGYIKVCRPRRFGLKVFKRVFMAVDGLKLLVFKSEQEYQSKNESMEVIYLPGCEVQTDLCLSSERYSIRLFVPVSRTNLPLSAVFNLKTNPSTNGMDEDIGLGGRLKRRASLLSLTSLSQFGATFGLQQTGGSSKGGGGGTGLCGNSVAVLGFLNELVLRFPTTEMYTEWLAFLRLATAVPSMGPMVNEDALDWDGTVPRAEWASILTRAVFDAEKKAIAGLIQLIRPLTQTLDDVDAESDFVRGLHLRLEERFADFLPMRLAMPKNILKNWTKDTLDGQVGPGHGVGTLSSDVKPPPSGSSGTKTGGGTLSGHQKSVIFNRICLAYRHIMGLSSTQAKLKYISAWEQLPHQGVAFFPSKVEVAIPLATMMKDDGNEKLNSQKGVPWLNRAHGGGYITVSNSRHIEAIGIGPTRIFRCDFQTGEIIASWRLSAIQGWHINWELGELVLLLKPQLQVRQPEDKRSASPPPLQPNPGGRVIIRPIDVSVRVVAEFLGGYTFLNLRSPEKNQELNENFFYKLTTGSSLPVHH